MICDREARPHARVDVRVDRRRDHHELRAGVGSGTVRREVRPAGTGGVGDPSPVVGVASRATESREVFDGGLDTGPVHAAHERRDMDTDPARTVAVLAMKSAVGVFRVPTDAGTVSATGARSRLRPAARN